MSGGTSRGGPGRGAGGRPRTSEAAGSAQGGEDSGLHLDVADTRRERRPQVLLLVFLRVGAERAVQPALP